MQKKEAFNHNDFYGAQLYGRVGYHAFEGITLFPEEKQRMIASMGDKHILVLRNHGIAVAESSIPKMFFLLWTVQRAAEIQCQAGALGGEEAQLSNEVRQKCADLTAMLIRESGFAVKFFDAMVRKVHAARAPLVKTARTVCGRFASIKIGTWRIVPDNRYMASKKRLARYSPSSEDFRKEEFPFYWLARLSGIYTMQMEKALKKIGTDIPTWRILFILKENGNSSISEISVHALAKLSTVTKIVYRMKAEGLVETNTSPSDGRVTEVSLTEGGKQAIARIQEATDSIFLKSFVNLSEGQINKLNRTLETIFNNLAED